MMNAEDEYDIGRVISNLPWDNPMFVLLIVLFVIAVGIAIFHRRGN